MKKLFLMIYLVSEAKPSWTTQGFMIFETDDYARVDDVAAAIDDGESLIGNHIASREDPTDRARLILGRTRAMLRPSAILRIEECRWRFIEQATSSAA